jgi:signal peptidase I
MGRLVGEVDTSVVEAVRPGRVTAAAGHAYRLARATLALLGLIFLVYFACFDLTQIVSPSMAPTLKGNGPGDGDWVLAERVTYRVRSPRRWEVVEFVNTEGLKVMKRVVGLPGERVTLSERGRVVVNGEELAWPAGLEYLHYYAYGPYVRNGKEVECGAGYFVLGDDSKDSQDGRYEGVLPEGRVMGRAWVRVAPRGRVGWVNP